MPKIDHTQESFNAGVIGPTLYGRTGLAKYQNGVSALENYVSVKEGPILNRPGTIYVDATSTSINSALMEFRFSSSQNYTIEIATGEFRFYRDRDQLLDDGTLRAGRLDSEIGPPDPLVVAHSYADADLHDIQYEQFGDVVYLAHSLYAPQKLTRTSDIVWTLSTVDFRDGPYDLINIDPLDDMTPSATTGTITLTAFVTRFTADDVGRLIRIQHGAQWGSARITVVTAPPSATATALVLNDFGATTASVIWRFGAWHTGSASTIEYPSTVSFHDGRLFFAASAGHPDTIWGSKVDDFENHQPSLPADSTVADDDAITRTISDGQVNTIRWMRSISKGLMIGTDANLYLGSGANQFDPLTPDNFALRRQSGNGSKAGVRPHIVDGEVVFADVSGERITASAFSFEDDQYIPRDLTRLSPGILSQGVIDSAYQKYPHNILWYLLSDGSVVGFTIAKEEDVIAPCVLKLGGDFTGSTHAIIESIAVSRDDTGANPVDVLWFTVKRTFAGSSTTARYIEYMTDFFTQTTDIKDSYFVDSGRKYDSTATTTIDHLDHLNGAWVDILAKGGVHPQQKVASGSVTLDYAAEKASVGLSYWPRMTSLPIQPAISGVNTIGKTKRIAEVHLLLNRSLGGEVGIEDRSDCVC